MRSVKLVAVIALLAGSVAFGQSKIVYSLELGGNNHADQWENNLSPSFTHGKTDNSSTVKQGDSITWAVRVSVGGAHVGNPGDGYVPYGAANLVFDLELTDSTGAPVAGFGAAPLALVGGQNTPQGKGFWSSINDGDAAGPRGLVAPDTLANAAFAIGIANTIDPLGVPGDPEQLWALSDGVLRDQQGNLLPGGGPNFDYGWYPTANTRGGIDIAGTKTIDTSINKTELDGKLVGFGAGYKSYEYTNYRPGVGMAYMTSGTDYGFGRFVDHMSSASDPLLPPAEAEPERVVFEGQISTIGLPLGTYTLKVVPSPDGNNILHGQVVWNAESPDYGGFGSFAAKANEVYPLATSNPGLTFQVTPPDCVPSVVARKLFYNQSYYDGNKIAIDAAPLAGVNNDDADAIDPNKTPLISGAATFANWTGYSRGINGLIYDVVTCPAYGEPEVGDFTFQDIGKLGTATPVAKPVSGFVTIPGGGTGGSTRVIITFANDSIANTWLKVTIGTGFGLPAADVHYWGNAKYDCGTASGVYIFVNSTDEVATRNNPWTSASPRAPITHVWDYNKDGFCNSTDGIGARNNPNNSTATCVRIITK